MKSFAIPKRCDAELALEGAAHLIGTGNPRSYAITLRGKSRLSPALPSTVSPDQIGIKRRLHFAGRTPCRAVECVDLFLDRAAGLGHRRPFNPLRRYRRALLGRIRRNQARMDAKSFDADKILLNAAAYRRIEQHAWHITVPERRCRLLEKVQRSSTPLQAKPAEPRTGEVQMHRLTQPAPLEISKRKSTISIRIIGSVPIQGRSISDRCTRPA